MANWSNEAEAREQIKALVAEYYHDFKEKKADFKPGDRVTYASRVFDEKEMCALTDATLDFWLTTGRFADEFEKEFAKWIGVKFANLVNSGSSANLIAFMALTAPELGDRQIKKGDEIITVACGFPTTVTPALQYGAVPVFVDVTVPQYNIDVTKLEAALSPQPPAVMIAHTLGNPFDLSAVKAFCRRAPELYLESARKLCSLRCLLYLILNGFYALASYRMPENLYFSIIRDTACLASSAHAYQAVRASCEPVVFFHIGLLKLAG